MREDTQGRRGDEDEPSGTGESHCPVPRDSAGSRIPEEPRRESGNGFVDSFEERMMDADTLFMILDDLANEVYCIRAITLKGRRKPVLSCSVPDGKVPTGWRRIQENKIQAEPGMQRIVWTGE